MWLGVSMVTADHDRSRARAVVFFAGTAWDGNRFPDQHIAERLARYTQVLYVDPPLSAVRAESRRGALTPRLVELGPSLVRLTPLAPPLPQRPGVRRVTAALARKVTRAAVRRLGWHVGVTVVASLSPFLTTFPGATRVLYGTDDFAAGAELMGVDGGWLRARQARQLADADVVIAVSDTLAATWRAAGASVSVVPNGVDFDHFESSDLEPWPDDVRLAPPVAGFIGHLSDRIDIGHLERLADTGSSVLLVGPRQPTFSWHRMEALLARPNVQWVGAAPFERLPTYMRAIDVGIVPYADSAFNRGSFPLKTLEYLAAGRPTVATDLPAIRWLDTDAVTIAEGSDDFAAKVESALGQPPDEEAVRERQSVAARNGWDLRAQEFAQILGLHASATQQGQGAVGSARPSGQG